MKGMGEGGMIFERLAVGPLQCNCYILGDERTREALVIDPGDEAGRILAVIGRHRLTVRAIVQTHAHFDHVGATAPLREATGAEVCLHPDDRQLYDHLPMQAEWFGLPAPEATTITRWCEDGDEIKAGSVSLGVLHTPGHTPGSVCLGASGLLFSGDTLFCGGVGRTDLWGGSYEQLMASLQQRLLALPEETMVYPGHGPESTIGRERRTNPFLQQLF
jgi:glyoxylase-like metal-dependent hydrolase (beta-lactamase superfamily II)